MRVLACRALAHLRRQWMGALSLFLVLSGGVAYAANTIGSSDIIDGQVKTPDLAANAVNSSKVADGQVAEADIGQGAVATNELKNDAVTSQKVLNETLVGNDILNNTLKGADIDESSLAGLPFGNADTLDGKDSTEFAPAEAYVKGPGRAVGQALAVQPGANTFLGPPLAGFLRLSYFCPSPTSNTGFLWIYNDSGSEANVFVDNGESNPTYRAMAAGANFFLPATPAGEAYSIQAEGALGIETIEVATVNRAGDCHAQAQALLTE